MNIEQLKRHIKASALTALEKRYLEGLVDARTHREGMRLIDADALKRYIDCGHLRPPTEICLSELAVVQMVDRMPTIEAEPVRHGRWEAHYGGKVLQCSICGVFMDADGKLEGYMLHYCPHCGAMMDGGEDK